MADPKDPSALAKRFIDLWQDQIGAVAGDPEYRDTLQRWMHQWSASAFTSPVTPFGQRPPSSDTERMDDEKGQPRPRKRDTVTRENTVTPETGTETASPASGDRDHELDELTRRVRELEERLASLGPALDDPPASGKP